MGKRIIFRERTGNGTVSDNATPMAAVSLAEPRVKFIKGWLTGGTDPGDGSVECGDGTAYPMEATPDQIAELYYRAKDAWFTGGSVSFTVLGSPASFNAPTTAPANRSFKYDAATYQQRGYTAAGGVHQFGGATYTSGGSTFSDIGTSEAGMWVSPWIGAPNAFRYFADDPNSIYVSDSEWFGTGGSGCKAEVKMNGKIAVVRVNPGDSVFASTTRLFIGLEFYFFDYNLVLNFGGTTDITASGLFGIPDPGATEYVCDYLIRMNSGILRAPFYLGIAGSDAGSHSGVDFTHDYAESWPYATKAGADAYDTTTGAPANGGPGA